MGTPQPEFFVQGADGRQYPADRATLEEWIRTGHVTPEQQVFIGAEQRWVRARELSFASAPAADAPAAPKAPANRRPLAIGCAILLLLAVICALIGRHEQSLQKVEAVRKQKAEQEDLRKKAAIAATRLSKQLDDHAEAMRAKNIKDIDAAMRRALIVAEPYRAMKPVPPELAELLPKFEAAKKESDLRAGMMKEYWNVVKKQGEATNYAVNNPARALMILKTAAADADRLIEQREENPDLLLPEEFEPGKRRKEMDKVVKNLAVRMREQREAEKEADALLAVCGKKPARSPYDGGFYQIESAVKERAHDPDSIEVKNCTDPLLYQGQCWVTTCDVRGRNPFGGLMLTRKKYSISNVGVSEIK